LSDSSILYRVKPKVKSHFYLSGSTGAESSQEDQCSVSSKDSTVEASSPIGQASTGPSPEGDSSISDHLQAKRARVENIIRVMAGSPNSRQHGESERSDTDLRDTREAREAYRENKRKQRLPQHQEHSNAAQSNRKAGNSSRDKQLQSMQRLLRQLQEKFLQVYNQEDPDYDNQDKTEAYFDPDILGKSSETRYISNEDYFEDKDIRIDNEYRDQMKVVGFPINRRDNQNLQDALKQELSKAVNDCVDRVFKKISSTGLDRSPQQRMCSTPELQISRGGNRKSQQHTPTFDQPQSEDPTEALSLVIRKPPAVPLMTSLTPTVKRPYPVHQAAFQLNYSTPLHESHILEHLLKYGGHSNLGALPCMPTPIDQASPDSVDLPWDTLAMRSKVTSAHLSHHPRSSSLGAHMLGSLLTPTLMPSCSLVKFNFLDRGNTILQPPITLRDIVCLCLTFNCLFSLNVNVNIQEGLTPSHLKKAKLMFFYTRYPSSNVLKTFFPDVKFNRCITSQLIKWFSNFREFYYIQMEKSARQAIVDGISDVKDMTVSRDSELFRALNMHYNKANDFHVPDRFLEVAEITLHEFYNAISAGKDSDPSWKKAIYKVICKLDNDVPEEFKTSSCF
uniref:Prospero homeobox protein 1-like n=1 Tax=Gouania willdenowi TaxID=441366 RepID=A0A8C5E0G6_GOUWI